MSQAYEHTLKNNIKYSQEIEEIIHKNSFRSETTEEPVQNSSGSPNLPGNTTPYLRPEPKVTGSSKNKTSWVGQSKRR